ncbi:MAG: GNAT family N-acetyltransferase [Methylovirgula sp.]
MADAAIVLRPAVPRDAALIFALVRELAAYERLPQDVEADEAMLAAALFGAQPRAFCTIADYGDAPAGFVLWFYTFSTFRSRHGIWIEDLYVRESFRGKGIGGAAFPSGAPLRRGKARPARMGGARLEREGDLFLSICRREADAGMDDVPARKRGFERLRQ